MALEAAGAFNKANALESEGVPDFCRSSVCVKDKVEDGVGIALGIEGVELSVRGECKCTWGKGEGGGSCVPAWGQSLDMLPRGASLHPLHGHYDRRGSRRCRRGYTCLLL